MSSGAAAKKATSSCAQVREMLHALLSAMNEVDPSRSRTLRTMMATTVATNVKPSQTRWLHRRFPCPRQVSDGWRRWSMIPPHPAVEFLTTAMTLDATPRLFPPAVRCDDCNPYCHSARMCGRTAIIGRQILPAAKKRDLQRSIGTSHLATRVARHVVLVEEQRITCWV